MTTSSRVRKVALTAHDHQMRIGLVIHPAADLLALLAATMLSVNKPWGRIRSRELNSETRLGLSVMLGLAGLVALFVLLHLAGVVPHGR